MSGLIHDLKHGIRMLIKTPGFTIVAVMILGLGIGVNSAIFQLVETIRLRSLPVPNAENVAHIRLSDDSGAWGRFETPYRGLSYPVWEEFRENQQAFSEVFAWSQTSFNLVQGGQTRFADGMWVSGNFFSALGVRAHLGRVFTEEDDRLGSLNVAVISHSFWQREYGGDPDIIGRVFPYDDVMTEIIGVTEPGFFGVEIGSSFDIAVPITLCNPYVSADFDYITDRITWWITLMGRLKPGVSIEQANTQLAVLSPTLFEATIPAEYPPDQLDSYKSIQLVAQSAEQGFSTVRESYSDPLWLLSGLAALVLLIASANLANLMLARANSREQETAVRLALGASRWRIVSQFLAESVVLSALGAGVGILLSQYFIQILLSLLGAQDGGLFLDIQLNWMIVAFTTAVASLTCIIFGLTPAIQGSRMAPAVSLKSQGRNTTASSQKLLMRRGLVVSQVAFSLLLLICAFLFSSSLQNFLNEETGFDRSNVLLAEVNFSALQLSREQLPITKESMMEKLNAIPGVKAAAQTYTAPLSGRGWGDQVWINEDGFEERFGALYTNVDDRYFEALDITLLAGRNFGDQDTQDSVPVAIISQTMAERFGEGENPVGKRFYMRGYSEEPVNSYEVIGVVENTKYYSIDEADQPIIYFARSQAHNDNTLARLMIKGDLPMSQLLSSIEGSISSIHPNIQFNYTMFEQQIANSLTRERILAILSWFFGSLAALLASIGLYGVISYMVQNRRNEIGIRMALGATKQRVSIMVLREALLLLSIGLGAGLFLSFLAGSFIQSLLFGIDPVNLLTYGYAILLLSFVAFVATAIPAWRATRIEPMTALRCE